jgi:hypothetical protein
MLTRQIALVSETPKIKVKELLKVGAALQKQATRDLGPIWQVKASVDVFASLDDVPLGYWPLIMVDDVPDAAGIHLDEEGQPYALAEAGPGWSLTASHECLEMLVDPVGNRLVAGLSPKKGQGRVEFLVEVCDPSEATPFGYTVNGVLVSDFYTPSYFDPVTSAAVRYSFTQAITKPRQVLRGGYLSWHDPVSNHWYQQTFFGAKATVRDLGVFSRAKEGTSVRTWVYRQTPERRAFIEPSPATGRATHEATPAYEEPANAKAKAWREQIAALKRRGRTP